MMIWLESSTGSNCFIPVPNRLPIPAAMISKVVFISFLFSFVSRLTLFNCEFILQDISGNGIPVICSWYLCSDCLSIYCYLIASFILSSSISILHTHLDYSSAISKNLHTFLLYHFLLSSLILLLPFLDRSSM